jgi:hypothetical protein
MSFNFGKTSSKQQSTSTPMDLIGQQFTDLKGPFADVLKGLLGGGASNPLAGIPEAPGPYSAPVTGTEQDFLSTLQGFQGPNGLATAGQDYLKDVISGKYADAGTNPFLKSYIEAAQRSTLRGLEETLTRSLPGRFTQAGQFVQPQGSSALDRAAAIATEGVAKSVSDIATNIGFGAYEQERGRQQQGVQLGQQEVQSVITNLQAQALPRLVEQYGIDQGLTEFRNRLNILMQVLNAVGGVTRPVIGNQAQSTGSSSGFNFGLSIPTGGAGGG